jgi:hypothetical protein
MEQEQGKDCIPFHGLSGCKCEIMSHSIQLYWPKTNMYRRTGIVLQVQQVFFLTAAVHRIECAFHFDSSSALNCPCNILNIS